MASLPESATRSRHWSVWSGSITDLRRVLRLIEDQYRPLLPAHVELAIKDARRRVLETGEAVAKWTDDRVLRDPELASMLEARDQQAHDAAKRDLRARQAEAEADGQIKLTIRYSDEDRRDTRGSADQLSEYLEDKRVSGLEFEAPTGYRLGGRITLSAGKVSGALYDGMSLHVSSSDARWATAAYSELVDEIQKNRPWWWWMRSLGFLLPFYDVCIAVAVLLAIPLRIGPKDTGWDVVLVVVGLLFAGIWPSFFGTWAMRRWVPAFELVKAGARSRGSAVLKTLGSGASAIVLGVVVNLIS